MSVSVRTADSAEAPDLARLHLEAALVAYASIFPEDAPKPTYEGLLARWEDWLHSGAMNRALVASEGEDLIGVVLVGPDPDVASTGHISRFYVRPDRWGTGVGRRLYDAAIAGLMGFEFPAASLWVLEHNQRARSWYERLGWRLTGERKPVYEPAGIVDVRYAKEL